MRISLGRSCIAIVVAGNLFSLQNASNAFAQTDAFAGKAGIVSVSASSVATVRIEVHAAHEQLVIPFCSEPGTADQVLNCNEGLEHSLMHFVGNKWVRTNPGYPGEVFGVEIGKWQPAVIPAGEMATFKFSFSPEFYHLRKGEKLRLEILAWASVESMANNGRPLNKFISPVFVCP